MLHKKPKAKLCVYNTGLISGNKYLESSKILLATKMHVFLVLFYSVSSVGSGISYCLFFFACNSLIRYYINCKRSLHFIFFCLNLVPEL